MPTFDRRNRRDLDQLVEEYITTNNINRRQFLQRATAAGLSISGASALLAACGGSPTPSGGPTKVTSIDALGVWSGAELDNFNAINTAFTQKYGIKVNVETSRDLPTILNTRVRGNNPPDVSGVPSIATFHKLASQGKLLQLDKFFDMSSIQQNYAQAWINLASDNGHLYAVTPTANTKGTIWYSPKQFTTNGYTVPKTWNDLIALSDKIASSGKFPWSMGVNSGAASGWPSCDWIDQIYLATNCQPASFLPYETPPKAYMYYLGDFTAGFIKTQFPSIAPGTDFNFFNFPSINPQFAGAVTGGADMLMAFKDNDGTRQYMQFLATAEAQEIWVKRGGKTSVNKAVPLSVYPDDVALNSAMQLSQATFFSLSQDDLMPVAMESAYWKASLDFISDPTKLDSILSTLESTAMQVYTS